MGRDGCGLGGGGRRGGAVCCDINQEYSFSFCAFYLGACGPRKSEMKGKRIEAGGGTRSQLRFASVKIGQGPSHWNSIGESGKASWKGLDDFFWFLFALGIWEGNMIKNLIWP